MSTQICKISSGGSGVVVLGAGVAGHTATAYLQKGLKAKEHKITVIAPSSTYQWIPSNIWVGVGKMTPEEIKFDLSFSKAA